MPPLSKLILAAGIALCPLSLPVYAEESATLTGVVLRAPAQSSGHQAVSRYRGRTALAEQSAGEDCQCNPGLYSVVYLTGDNLPPLSGNTDSIPRMAQKDQRFEPSVMAVSVGTKVSFPNLDPFYHNVFSYSKTKRFDLGRYPQGESKVVEFDKPGLVKIFCEIHFSMRAYVHVLETPYFATSDEQGQFRIDNIAPGTYTLNVWQENLPLIQRPVTVTQDSTHIEIE